MGLDFKSYANFTGPDGVALLGNVFYFSSEDVAEAFEPSVGLFVTLLHLCLSSPSLRVQKAWLATYQTLQRVFISTAEPGSDTARYAEDAVNAISNSQPDSALFERLFLLLDSQSQIRGVQAPSQRRVQRDPKGVFCNLHLSDRKCNQDFACNQLHLLKTGDTIKHRHQFYAKMVDILRDRSVPEPEILHRVKDVIFFSRFGNRVTVRYGSGGGGGYQGGGNAGCIQYFKTAYTQGRLLHALRHRHDACPSQGGRCRIGDQCMGIHVQDERNLQFSKPMDLTPAAIAEASDAIESEALRLLSSTPTRTGPPQPAGTSPTSLAPIAAGTGASATAPPVLPQHGSSSGSLDSPSSPTTRGWAEAVKQYKNKQGDDGKHHASSANPMLLEQLKNRPVESPVTPDGATPLLAEVQNARFTDERSFSN